MWYTDRRVKYQPSNYRHDIQYACGYPDLWRAGYVHRGRPDGFAQLLFIFLSLGNFMSKFFIRCRFLKQRERKKSYEIHMFFFICGALQSFLIKRVIIIILRWRSNQCFFWNAHHLCTLLICYLWIFLTYLSPFWYFCQHISNSSSIHSLLFLLYFFWNFFEMFSFRNYSSYSYSNLLLSNKIFPNEKGVFEGINSCEFE